MTTTTKDKFAQKLISWYLAMQKRKNEVECYDNEFETSKEEANYQYLHWNAIDTIKMPECVASEALIKYTRSGLLELSNQLEKKNVQCPRIGGVTMRILRYNQLKPQKRHYDINLFTYNVGSMDNDAKFYPAATIHWGTFAERLIGVKATPHKFNPKGHRYSIVLFFAPHHSLVCPDGRTVSQILTENCYSK